MKKSFILHIDSLEILPELSTEQQAELFMAIYNYQLGKEIKLSQIVKIAFIPLKNQFDRDNEKYKSIVERNRKNGKKGGRPKNQEVEENPKETKKPTGLFGNPKEPKKADNVNGSDNVNGNEKDNEEEVKKETFNFRKELLNLGIENQIVLDFLKVRKNKKASDTVTAFNSIKKQIEISEKSANECIKIAVEKSWAGFNAKWLEKENKKEINNFNVNELF